MRAVLLTIVAATTSACALGVIGGDDENASSTGSAVCGARVEPGPSTVRRLTRFEYENTVRDLLGEDGEVAKTFAAEEVAYGFDNNADALNVSPLLAEQYLEAAEVISRRAVKDLSKLLPCDPRTLGEHACARAFVEKLATRAYRRPATFEEIARLLGAYESGRAEGGFEEGVRTVLEVVLQSPQFLYRIETGVTESGGVSRIVGTEMATRLAYLLWGTTPDDVLLAAAREGRLDTRDQIAAQAKRMIDDPRARRMVASFHAQWLGLDALFTVTKSKQAFPEFDEDVRRSMAEETRLFLDAVFWKEGRFEALFTSPYTFVDAKLARFYGVSVPASSGFVKVVFPNEQRVGLLTQGSLLTLLAKAAQTSPVARGKFVRERLLCHELAPPPMDVVIAEPSSEPGKTTRERFAAHTKNPTCAGCHKYMDGIGFGFEGYDAVGRKRLHEDGLPIDARGELTETLDVDGPFEGAVELARRLASSAQVKSCYVTQWFRFAYGRKETPRDHCTLEKLRAAFAASNHDPRALLVALTQTDVFLHRRNDAGGAP